MSETPKKMALIFGDVTLTFTPADIEAVLAEWRAENPGKTRLDMPGDEFAERCMKRLIASVRPTRTVIHN